MNLGINIFLWITYAVSLYFSVFILLIYLDKKDVFRKEENDSSEQDGKGHSLQKLPLVSVLVPAFNEEKTIIRTLESIHQLDYPKERLEVIVIDDGSKDKTKKMVGWYIQDKSQFKLISHQNCGKAASLNKALKIAKGEFFACLDADSFVDRATLKKMLVQYYSENDPKLAIITPAMKVYQPKNLLQRLQWLEYIVIILIARLSSQIDSLYVAPGPFSLYRTEIIRKLGGFDEKSITEDQEIAYRVQKEQYKIKQCPKGYVYTVAPEAIRPFYRQRRRWYLGSLDCVYKYRGLIANQKYGDFGMMQMIKNALGYFLAITGMGLAVYIFILPLLERLKNLVLIKFNIWPYLLNLKLNLNFLSFLLIDFRKGVVIVFLGMVGITLFYLAHKNANEKMIKFGWIPLIPYAFFYYLLKGTILLLSLFEFARGKKIKW
ncbi:MAG TPA: glycosyltransferase [Candidatus Nanoarchaeia archaeon]|nr:glycosyltransferase [Candidatus Nanoarchaeia archaeon]